MIFRRLKKLRERDRALGLVFSWRLPLSSRGSFWLSLFLVSILAVIFVAGVRVRGFGKVADVGDEARLIILPGGHQGNWVERWAMESGPFPARWNLASDPDYVAMRAEALRSASETGPLPSLRLAEIDWVDKRPVWDKEKIMHLPSLPEPKTSAPKISGERIVPLVLHLLSTDEGVVLVAGEMTHESSINEAEVGVRFFMKHDAQGRVQEIIRFDPAESQPDLLDWMMRHRVRGHAGKSGWVMVETAVKS